LNTPARASLKGLYIRSYSDAAVDIVGWPGLDVATISSSKSLLGSDSVSLASTRFLGAISIPANYVISMFVTPLGKVAKMSSILHATKSGSCCAAGTRGPLFGLNPDSLIPFVSFGSAASADIDGNLPELPLNSETKVTLIQNE